jgi:hypothetical protein
MSPDEISESNLAPQVTKGLTPSEPSRAPRLRIRAGSREAKGMQRILR